MISVKIWLHGLHRQIFCDGTIQSIRGTQASSRHWHKHQVAVKVIFPPPVFGWPRLVAHRNVFFVWQGNMYVNWYSSSYMSCQYCFESRCMVTLAKGRDRVVVNYNVHISRSKLPNFEWPWFRCNTASSSIHWRLAHCFMITSLL